MDSSDDYTMATTDAIKVYQHNCYYSLLICL